MAGWNVRLARPMRLMNDEMGHRCEHHLRKKITSTAISAGMMSTDQVTSPPPNSAISRNTMANDRPTGHTRQNTGNPKMAAESRVPPRIMWRESAGFRSAQEEHPPAHEVFRARFSAAERGVAFVAGAAEVASVAEGRPRSPPTEEIPGAASGAEEIPEAAPAVEVPPFLKMPRSLLHTGTGQSHPQKARPRSRMAATASTMEMTARGTSILLASMVPKAPIGQISEMDSQPKADSVPALTWAA